MANALLAFNNRTDAATLSGGSWQAALPLTNLQTRQIKQVARSSNLLLASTQFVIDLGPDKLIRLLALVGHNMSLTAKYRLRGHNEASITKYANRTHSAPGIGWQSNTAGFTTGNSAVNGPDGTPAIFVAYSGAPNNTGQSLCSVPSQAVGAYVTARVSLGAYNGITSCSLGVTNNLDTWGSSADSSIRIVSGPGVAVRSVGALWDITGLSATQLTEVEIVRHLVLGGSSNLNWYPNNSSAQTNSAGLVWYPNMEVGNVATSRYPVASGTSAVRPAGYFDNWQDYSYNGGWKDVWPPVYSTYSLDWQSLNWFSGRYLDEERQGYTWNLSHILPSTVNYRYWFVELDDSLRTDLTYIDIGRLFTAAVWTPVVNMSNGAGLGWETATQVQKAIGGAKYFQRRTPYRVAQFATEFMMDDEAFANAFDIQRRMGLDAEVYYVYDPSDTVHLLRRSFLGTLRKLTPIQITNFLIRGTQWEVEESI